MYWAGDTLSKTSPAKSTDSRRATSRRQGRFLLIASLFRSTSIDVSTNFLWSRFSCMEIPIEVGGSRYTSVEVSKVSTERTEVSSVGVSGSFHCFHQLRLLRINSVEASMSFHIRVPLHTSTYFHTSITNFQLLPQDVHKDPSTSVRSTSMEVSTWFHGYFPWNWIYIHGSQFSSVQVGGNIFSCMEIAKEFVFPWKYMELSLSVEVEATIASTNCSFHEYIPWKLPWASISPTYFHLLPRASQTPGYFTQDYP